MLKTRLAMSKSLGKAPVTVLKSVRDTSMRQPQAPMRLRFNGCLSLSPKSRKLYS